MRTLPFIVASLSLTALAQGSEQEPGTVTLKNGVIVKTLKQGDGPRPRATDKVKVHYRGVLPDTDKEFDSSYKRGEPVTFGLNQVIACWSEGLQRVQAGSKVRLVCPPATAYGSRGAPPTIPPNATLVFDVELFSVEPAPRR